MYTVYWKLLHFICIIYNVQELPVWSQGFSFQYLHQVESDFQRQLSHFPTT